MSTFLTLQSLRRAALSPSHFSPPARLLPSPLMLSDLPGHLRLPGYRARQTFTFLRAETSCCQQPRTWPLFAWTLCSLLHLPPHLISLTSKCQSLLSQMCGNCLSSSGTSDSLWPPLSIATGLAVMRGTLLVSLALSVLPPGPPLLMAWALWRALKRPHAVSVPATSLPLLHPCCPHTVGWAESRAFPAGLLIIGSFCSARLMGLSWS